MRQLEADGIPQKKLILRLSSLGDVILSTAALETAELSRAQVDWVVAPEFAPLLQGHPRIHKLLTFDRRAGLSAWIKLCRALWEENYAEVVDLHASLRTRVLKILFRFWALTGGKPMPRWRRIRKTRWRLYGYFTFKKFWPESLRPRPMVERFARAAGGDGWERPNLSYLVESGAAKSPVAELARPYVCVMPGAAWPGKRWPASHYVDVVRAAGVPAVVLGAADDAESIELAQQLKNAGLPFVSGVGKWTLAENSRVLAGSTGYLGNDTGFAHLAQALGVRATVVLGPTARDQGFGPWRPGSASVSAALWCSPCGKDGRFCFRLANRYACMSKLSPEVVAPHAGRPE